MQNLRTFVPLLTIGIVFGALLAACGPTATATSEAATKNFPPTAASTAIPSATPDPCADANRPASVQKVDELTRQFNDATSILAQLVNSSSISAGDLTNGIVQLQAMRRSAEDLSVPSCLQNLHSLQVDRMNAVIQYFLLKLGKADPKIAAQQGAQADQLAGLYQQEKLVVLGLAKYITFTPTAGTPGSPTPTSKAAPASATPLPIIATPTSTVKP